MKIVVIGGGGLVGKKLVTALGERGQEAVGASRSSGVIILSYQLSAPIASLIAAICVRKSPRKVDPVRRNTLFNRPRYAVL